MSSKRAADWRTSPVRAAIRRCSLALASVAVFSGFINILALTGSFYMLQVYDRVLTSRSVPTLVGLTVLMAEQNFHQAIRIADRGYIIVHGEIVFEGDVNALEQNELVKNYYLGASA